MKVRTLKEEDNIKNIAFGEHIVGYRFGPNPHDKQIYRPFGTSHTQRKKNEDVQTYQTRHICTSNTGRYSPEKARSPIETENEAAPEYLLQQFSDLETAKRQEEKHMDFIRSYQGWLHDTHTDGYQTVRMTTTLGVKRNRTNQKSARGTHDNQIYNIQTSEYKQGNIFPCRKNTSVKRIQRKPQPPSLKPTHYKYKGEGELKVNIIRSMVRPQNKIQPRKSHQTRPILRTSSALLRSFSNPKILSIENRQLVTGTRIFLH